MKERQKYLKNLNEEVNKSKMAVVTILTYSVNNRKLSNIRNELQKENRLNSVGTAWLRQPNKHRVQKKCTHLSNNSGGLEIAHHVDERRNVQFPKNTKTRIIKKRRRSRKEN